MRSLRPFPSLTQALTAAIFLLAGCSSASAEATGKYPLFPDGLKYLDPPKLADSQAVATSIRVLSSAIPYGCHVAAYTRETPTSSKNCALPSLEVLEVTYSDCEEPWILCRCADAPISRENMIELFGGLPPNLRGAVRNLAAFKTNSPNGGGHAYADNGGVVLFGDVGVWTVFTHEAAHCVDADARFSGTAEYRAAMDKDTCAADYYAASAGAGNTVEPWAQVFVINRFKQMGGTLESNATCLQNQLDLVEKQTGKFITEPRCDLSRKSSKGVMWQRTPEEALDPKIDARNITNTDTPKENSPSKTAAETKAETSETVKNTVVVKTNEPEGSGAVRGWQMLTFGPLAVGVVVWTMV